jgi:hypothetical protein
MDEQPDTAAHVHAAAMQQLKSAGFFVYTEWWLGVDYMSEEGRIDIVAYRDGQFTGIEIDRRRPRKKSLEKLRGFRGGRIVVLRGANCVTPSGIDAVVSIPVRIGRAD